MWALPHGSLVPCMSERLAEEQPREVVQEVLVDVSEFVAGSSPVMVPIALTAALDVEAQDAVPPAPLEALLPREPEPDAQEPDAASPSVSEVGPALLFTNPTVVHFLLGRSFSGGSFHAAPQCSTVSSRKGSLLYRASLPCRRHPGYPRAGIPCPGGVPYW